MCPIIYCALFIQILIFYNPVLLFKYAALDQAEPCSLALWYNLQLFERANSACIMYSTHLASSGPLIYSVNDLF